MIEIVYLIIYCLIQFFDGKGDVGNSITEIRLAQARIDLEEFEELKEDTKRRSKWHKSHAVRSILVGIGFSVAIYSLEWISIFSLVLCFNLRQLIFNPTVGLGIGKSFFYVSPKELAGIPDKIGDKIWWIANLVMAIGMGILIKIL